MATNLVKPVASDDFFVFDEDQEMGGNILANDVAGSNGNKFLRSFDSVGVDAKSMGRVTDIVGDYGVFHVKPDGSFTYELNADVKANLRAGTTLTEQVAYKISDGSGHTDTGYFHMDIVGKTAAPVVVDDSFTFNEGDAMGGNVLANDIPGDNGKIFLGSIEGVKIPSNASADAVFDVAGDYGVFHFKADGSFTYDLSQNVASELNPGETVTDTLRYYKVSDGLGNTDVGKLSVTVNGTDPGPKVVNDEFSFFESDAIGGNVLANDAPGDNGNLFLRSIAGVKIPSNAGSDAVFDVAGDHGVFHFKADGSFTYDLSPSVKAGLDVGETVTDTLRYYKVSDGLGNTDSGKVTVTIAGDSPAPVASNDSFTFNETDSITGSVLANDFAGVNGNIFLRSIEGVKIPSNAGSNDVFNVAGDHGVFHFKADGSFTYDLNAADAAGLDAGESLTETLRYYKVSDGSGHTDSALLHVVIDGVTDGLVPA